MSENNFSIAFESERSMIGQDNDVIHEAVTNSMEILRKESRIWTRKGKLEAYRHAFSSLAPNILSTLYGEDNDSLDDIDSQKGPTTFSINRKDDILSKAILENAHVGHLNEALLSFKKALIFAKTPNQIVTCYFERAKYFASRGMYDRAEQDLVFASTETLIDSTKMYQIFHKLAQVQLKMKKRRESIASLIHARQHLITANVSNSDKIKFDIVLKDSITKISKRIAESKLLDTDETESICGETSKYVPDNFTPHQDNDALSASVTLKTDPGKGRYTVASEDIKIGSIIAAEEPTAFILNPDDSSLILEFCHNCLRQIPMSFVPCEGCTSVIFCSKDCRKSAMSKTHRFECELDLYGMRSRSNASSFRIFLALQTILQYPIDEIDKLQKSHLMKMVAHEQIRIFEVELKNLAITTLILILLRKTSYYLKQSLKDDKPPENLTQQELKLAEMIDRLLRIQNYNTHPILTTNAITDNLTSNQNDFSVGLCRIGDSINVAIGSNFNHSCNPNTLRINSLGSPRTYLIASRNIPKGEEINDIYSMHYSEIPKSSRKEWLQDNFLFECVCKACKENWPTFDCLPKVQDVIKGKRPHNESKRIIAAQNSSYK